jgi:iron complex outermembrane receptor protein
MLLGVAATAAALCMRPGQAQQAGSEALEEVIVTAQKRAEKLQDTPIAVSAVTGETIERLNLDDVASLAVSNPSLAYSEAGGEAQIYIRGVGSNIFSVGVDQSVATHIDGVYVGRANMGLTQFLDVDRVEVLRGPQGTLYGRNATGGAINVISRMPTDEVEGYGSLLFGSFDRREIRAAVSGPLGGGWAARVAVRGMKDDGYTRDVDARGSNKIDDNDLKAVRGALRWKNDSLAFTVLSDYSEFDNGNTSIVPLDSVGLAQSFGAVATGDIHRTRNNTPSFHKWQTGGVALNLEWQINDALTLTSISGYREWDSDFLFNTDGTEIEITRSTFIYDSTQYSSELRLAGEHDWGNWIVGGYYFDEDKFGALGLVRAGFTPPTVLSARSFNFFADGTSEALAVFGQGSYKLNDQWRVTAGIRFSEEKKEDNLLSRTIADPQLLGLFDVAQAQQAGTGVATRIADRSWRAYTPKLGLEWRPSDDQLYYASYSKGFKSGGYNDLSVVNPAFNPEFIKSYEIGAKTEWLDNRLRLNGTLFYYDYTDLQVSVFASVGAITTTITTNAAAATVKGAELELLARPVRNFDISASISLLDATYDRFTTPYGTCTLANRASDPFGYCQTATIPAPPPLPANPPRLINASGNTLNNAPEVKGTLSASYGIDLANGGRVTLFGQVAHQGRVFFLPANTSVMSQDAYTLVDARIGYATANGALELSVFGKNLGDEDYFHNIVQFTSTSDGRNDPFTIGNALGYPAPGRQWGVELLYRFGQ